MNRWFYRRVIPMFFIMFFAISFFMVIEHEKTHVAIWNSFGYNASYTLTVFGGITSPDMSQNFTVEDLRIIMPLHAINELVSYQYGVFMAFVFGMIIIFMVVIDTNNEKLIASIDLVKRYEELEKLKKVIKKEFKHY